MKKSFLKITLVICSLFLLIGCSKNNSTNSENSKVAGTGTEGPQVKKDEKNISPMLEYLHGLEALSTDSNVLYNYVLMAPTLTFYSDDTFEYTTDITIHNESSKPFSEKVEEYSSTPEIGEYVIPSLKDITSTSPSIKTELFFSGKYKIKNNELIFYDTKLDPKSRESSGEWYSINELKTKMSAEDYKVLTQKPDISNIKIVQNNLTPEKKDVHGNGLDFDFTPVDTLEKVNKYGLNFSKDTLNKMTKMQNEYSNAMGNLKFNLVFIDNSVKERTDRFYKYYSNPRNSDPTLEEYSNRPLKFYNKLKENTGYLEYSLTFPK